MMLMSTRWRWALGLLAIVFVLACEGKGPDKSHNDQQVNRDSVVYEVRFMVETNAKSVHLDDFKATDSRRDDRFETIAPEWKSIKYLKAYYWRFEFNADQRFHLYAKASIELGREPQEKTKPVHDIWMTAKFVTRPLDEHGNPEGGYTVVVGGCTPKNNRASTIYPSVLTASVYCVWER